ncbi:MAG: apolipoprotein N-acyltransferase [Desulfobacteraceae bacterium]|nr:apolipoprotein N-acyltransferase [Desulfobacteraceae bacterium]
MLTFFKNHRDQVLLAMLSGLLLWLAFPKLNQSYLAWCALVPMLMALRDADGRTGLKLGFVTGLVQYLGLMYWTAYTMTVYGKVPLVTSLGALLLLSAILGTYTALFGLGVSLLCARPWRLAVGGPLIWVLLEWLRGWLFTGFPWELLGYSQYTHLGLIQISDLFGVPGVSALIAAVNVILALAVLHWRRWPWQRYPVSRSLMVRAATAVAVLLVATLAYGAYRIHATDQAVAKAPTTQVAVIQGNVDQDHKWDEAFQLGTTVKYKDLSLLAAQKGVDLVVWPETATPFYMFYERELTDIVLSCIRQANTFFIIGSPSAEPVGKNYLYYNSAYLFSPQAKVVDRYDKVHLVPFGEYVPLKRWLPFLGKMVEQVGDFTPGRQGNVLKWHTAPVGMLVCYEAIFPDLARAMVNNGAQLLINITNDAWFGRTSAAYQHFSMAVFRCVENRRSMARAANTGISGFIDPCGRIISQTPLYEDLAPVGKVALLTERTLYTCWGDWPLAGVCLFAAVVLGVMRFKA